jgi:aromatic ring-opening dioxygenase LigB subunit
MPLSLLVGAWLLSGQPLASEPAYLAIGPDGEPVTPWPDLPPETGVLVMGDGSARRSLKGPGYFDERAEPFDAAVVKALADGSARSLADLDLELADQLLAAGAPAWKAAVHLLGLHSSWHAEVLYADAPYGVMYTVASWLPA